MNTAKKTEKSRTVSLHVSKKTEKSHAESLNASKKIEKSHAESLHASNNKSSKRKSIQTRVELSNQVDSELTIQTKISIQQKFLDLESKMQQK